VLELAKCFAVGGILQETNSFCKELGTIEWFKSEGYYTGEEIFNFRNTNCVLGGILDAAKAFGWEIIPTMIAGHPLGTGSGPVTKEAFDCFLNELTDRIRAAGKLDGVFVLSHGAMITEEHIDGDGYVLSAIREIVGEDVPMATTYDVHGAISSLIVEKCDIVTAYDTYPHTDWYERGYESAKIMNLIVQSKVKPTRVLRKPRILPNLPGEYTGRHPMATAIDLVHKIEAEDKVVNVTINPGFPYCDSPNAGFSIVVTTNNDEKIAEEKADQIEKLVWKERHGFVKKCLPVEEAIEEALRPEQAYRGGPVVLADEGDSVGSHSPGDGTSIFRAILERGIKNTAVHFLDPENVKKAIKAGVGNKVTMEIGGKVDEPVRITGTVKTITDGDFEPPVLRGRRDLHSFSMGKTVLLKCEGNDVVLTQRPCQFNFLYDWRNVGVEPLRKKIIVIKSPVHYREHFEPVSSKIIEVDTPGLSSVYLEGLNYQNIRRPMIPFDKL